MSVRAVSSINKCRKRASMMMNRKRTEERVKILWRLLHRYRMWKRVKASRWRVKLELMQEGIRRLND
jgi:hypothetical protein